MILTPHEVALDALALGLSPVPPRPDGSKAPLADCRLPDGKMSWLPYQSEPATEEHVRHWYLELLLTGVGLLTGYGDLELLEFDHWGTYQAYLHAANELGFSDLVEHVQAGYLEKTPGGGVHWLYYCPLVLPNTKLAERPIPGDPHRREVLIETRGQGGYVVIAPSFGPVHPTGKPYELLRGGLASIARLEPAARDVLWNLARVFDEVPEPPQKPRGGPGYDGRPGDDFEARTTWEDLLEPFGWTRLGPVGNGTGWRRPGKDKGISATTGHCKGLYVFSTSTAFEPRKSYSKFGAYALLHHGGDYAAAARQLAREGYGTRAADSGQPRTGRGHSAKDSGSSRPPPDSTTEKGNDWELATTRASEIRPEPVTFLAGDVFPKGKLITLAGLGGAGKGMFWANAVADFTQGRATLGLEYEPPPAIEVLLVGCEDGYSDTVVPRLLAAGADLAKVHILEGVRDPEGKIRPFSLYYLPAMERYLAQHSRIALVVIDPITSYIARAGAKDNNDAEVRSLLEPLAELAHRLDTTILTTKHLNKDEAKTLTSRVGGSVAYVNVPRACFVIAEDPEHEGRRILAPFKWNLNAPRPPSIAWTMTPLPEAETTAILAGAICSHLSETAKDQLAGQLHRLSWTGIVDTPADDLLRTAAKVSRQHTRAVVDQATQWLQKRLADGPAGSVLCAKEGDLAIGRRWPEASLAHQERTKAVMGRTKWWREEILKNRLSGEAKQVGFHGPWMFRLPHHAWPPSADDVLAARAVDAAELHPPVDSVSPPLTVRAWEDDGHWEATEAATEATEATEAPLANRASVASVASVEGDREIFEI
jgi:hypothetical protein